MSLKRKWYFFALFFFVLIVQLPFLGDLVGANTATRFALVEAIVDHHTTRIDLRQELTLDKSFVDGHFYSDKAPGMSFLAIVPYWAISRLFDAVGLSPTLFVSSEGAIRYATSLATQKFTILMTSGLLLAALAVAFFRLSLELLPDRRTALLATMFMAFGTPLIGWAATIFGHVGAATCLFGAFALSFRIGRSTATGTSWLSGAGAGGLLGLAFMIEFTAAPAILILAVYGIHRATRLERGEMVRTIGCAVLAGVIVLIPMAIYQQISFGSPFRIGYSSVQGFEGMEQGLLGLTYPKLHVLYEITLGLRRGILWMSPVLAVAPIGFWLMIRCDGLAVEATVAGAIILYYFAMNASYFYWDGGFSAGPRHITAALPFMALGVGFALDGRFAWLRRATILLGMISIAICLCYAATSMVPADGYPFPLLDVSWPLILEARTGFSAFSGHWSFQIVGFSIWLAIAVSGAFILWKSVETGGSPRPVRKDLTS